MRENKRIVRAGSMAFPVLGQGAWHIGDDPSKAKDEIAALRLGVELGMTLIDTAEMYGEGRSESLIARALEGMPRDRVQLVSKVYPHNAGRRRIGAACDASLRRLQTDYLDLYLLHWRGSVPLAETVNCMEDLVRSGKILRWGVSNFDTDDMEELWDIPDGSNCAANQVLYHLGSRGIEFDLLPWMKAHGVALMAYCPLAQGGTLSRRLGEDGTLRAVARKYGVGVMQLLLAFVLRQEQTIAIPKAGSPAHVRENAAASNLSLTPEDWVLIDRAFPPPARKTGLDMQ